MISEHRALSKEVEECIKGNMKGGDNIAKRGLRLSILGSNGKFGSKKETNCLMIRFHEKN